MKQKLKMMTSLLGFAAVIALFLLAPKHVSADNINVTFHANWSEMSCTGSLTGSTGGDQYGAAAGDNLTVTIANDSAYPLTTYYTEFTPANNGNNEPSIVTAAHSSGSFTLSDLPNADGTQGGLITTEYKNSTCQTPLPADMWVEAGLATLSCTVNNGSWKLTGNYSGIVWAQGLGLGVYEGSTYYSTVSNGTEAGTVNVSVSTRASNTTFYAYNGPSSSDRQLAFVTCPGVTASSPSSPSSTSSGGPGLASSSTTPAVSPPSPPATNMLDGKATVNGQAVDANSPEHIGAKNTSFFSGNDSLFLVLVLVLAAAAVAIYAGAWKVLRKAGKPGWAAIVPFYNTWLIYELGDKPGWWTLLQFIPIVNIVAIVVFVLAEINIAKKFGKSPLFGFLGLFLFSFIGWPQLGFSKAKYKK